MHHRNERDHYGKYDKHAVDDQLCRIDHNDLFHIGGIALVGHQQRILLQVAEFFPCAVVIYNRDSRADLIDLQILRHLRIAADYDLLPIVQSAASRRVFVKMVQLKQPAVEDSRDADIFQKHRSVNLERHCLSDELRVLLRRIAELFKIIIRDQNITDLHAFRPVQHRRAAELVFKLRQVIFRHEILAQRRVHSESVRKIILVLLPVKVLIPLSERVRKIIDALIFRSVCDHRRKLHVDEEGQIFKTVQNTDQITFTETHKAVAAEIEFDSSPDLAIFRTERDLTVLIQFKIPLKHEGSLLSAQSVVIDAVDTLMEHCPYRHKHRYDQHAATERNRGFASSLQVFPCDFERVDQVHYSLRKHILQFSVKPRNDLAAPVLLGKDPDNQRSRDQQSRVQSEVAQLKR